MLALPRWLSFRRQATPPGSEPFVRTMRPEDRAEVLRIEAASFPDAWTGEVLDDFLARGASGHVLEQAGRCVGFFLVLRARDSLLLANLAVAPEVRRSGIATLALRKIEGIAWAYGLPRIELQVRETNLAAQLLYRRNGYRAVEILRGYYTDQDGYRMTKDVTNLPGPRRAAGTATGGTLES